MASKNCGHCGKSVSSNEGNCENLCLVHLPNFNGVCA